MHDVCQMFVFALSQQIDTFHLDINEHVLFSSFSLLPHVNGRRWQRFMQLDLPPSVLAAKSLSLALSPSSPWAASLSSLCYLQPQHRRLIWEMSLSLFFCAVRLLNNWSKWCIFLFIYFFVCELCACVWALLKQPAVKVVFPLGLCGHN